VRRGFEKLFVGFLVVKVSCAYCCIAVTRCTDLKYCGKCQQNPSCGWCDDGSWTGLGSCFDGGRNGPLSVASGNESVETCSRDHWYFTSCPREFCCVCNFALCFYCCVADQLPDLYKWRFSSSSEPIQLRGLGNAVSSLHVGQTFLCILSFNN